MVANLTREGGVSLVVDQSPSTILNKIKQNKSIDYNIFVTVRSKITTQFLALTIYCIALAIYGLIIAMIEYSIWDKPSYKFRTKDVKMLGSFLTDTCIVKSALDQKG